MSGVLGLDPGAKGAAAFLDDDGSVELAPFAKMTDQDAARWIRTRGARFALLERVASRPGQGVASSFKFGRASGFLQGVLWSSPIRWEFITPAQWKRRVGCIAPKGSTQTERKRIDKQEAQRRYPELGKLITNDTADALLIADVARCVARLILSGERLPA